MKRTREKTHQQQIDSEAVQQQSAAKKKKLLQVLDSLRSAASSCQKHDLKDLLEAYKQTKHPILQTLQPQPQIYKYNPDKKKKPIELYLDTVNTIYKKKDLDLLINPVAIVSVFEKWAPREIAIFQLAIQRFGKQFEYISQLIQSKTTKEVYEFYLEWNNTTHFKSYKNSKSVANRANYESFI